LVELLRRERLSDVWPVTVGGAVERCRLVRGEGSIVAAEGAAPGEIALVAREPIADLSLAVWSKGRDQPMRLVTQLVAGFPRRIPLDEAQG